MPVTDWTRTDVDYPLNNGATALRFDKTAFAAFELFILKRENARKTYTDEQIDKAESLYNRLEPTGKKQLTETIILGLPGDEEMTLSKFRELLQEYNSISRNRLQQ